MTTRRLTPAEIAAKARALGLDPDAVLRVGSTEGLSGGIGDGGHAFGPFQLNDAGGVITGKFPGWDAQQKQDWAWSTPGVDYALGGIANVAKGLSGPDAVNAIVTKFERPKDPQGEIARALGQHPMAGSPPLALAASSTNQPQQAPLAAAFSRPQASPYAGRAQFLQALLGAQQNGQLDPAALLQALIQRRQSLAT